jgi:hypothetical protein
MGLHGPFGHLQHKLCAKEGLRVKLAIWLPTTKSQESTRPQCVQGSSTHRWKALKKSYKFSLDLIPIGGLNKELWPCEVLGVQIGTISRLHLGNPETKAIRMWVWRSNAENTIWGKVVASPSPGRGESSESMLPVACPNTKMVPKVY